MIEQLALAGHVPDVPCCKCAGAKNEATSKRSDAQANPEYESADIFRKNIYGGVYALMELILHHAVGAK